MKLLAWAWLTTSGGGGLARAAAQPAVPHRWTRDVAADLRRQLDNYRRSVAAAVDSDDRRLLLDRIAALERELAGPDPAG